MSHCLSSSCKSLAQISAALQTEMLESHRVAFGPAHHLTLIEPLRGEHLVEAAQGELALSEDPRDASCCEATQAALEPPLVLLLWTKLPSADGGHH